MKLHPIIIKVENKNIYVINDSKNYSSNNFNDCLRYWVNKNSETIKEIKKRIKGIQKYIKHETVDSKR